MVEEGIRITYTEKEEQVDIAKNKVTKDSPVVESWCVIDLFPQEPIWLVFIHLSKETPIHINVPDIAVGSLNKVTCHVNPEKVICLILEASFRFILCQKVEDSW